MSEHNPSSSGIHLTKQYYKEDFGPSDFQWDVTKIDEDFTLFDLFKLIKLAETITPGIAKVFGMPNFDLFWDQINKPREQDDKDDIEYLELYWTAECDLADDTNEEIPEKSELSNLMSFHGIGLGCPSEEFHDCDEDCPKDQGYGIEFTPINNLAHLPIRVSPNVCFCPPFTLNKNDYHRTKFQLKINPTLWCFITSIFWELTFVDLTPDKIADSTKQLFDQVSEIRKQLADGNTDYLKNLS